MANIGFKQTKDGIRYYVQLSPGENKSRPKIFLGSANVKQAEAAKYNIENLLLGSPLPKSVKEWLDKIKDESIIRRLESLGLIEPKAKNRWTVSAWVESYITQRPDVKAATLRKWRDVQNKLKAFFRDDFIGDITTQHAKNFQVYLKSTAELGENTQRRHIGIARQFFNAAVDAEIITKNPFKSKALPVSVKPNESRFFFITQETAYIVLAACPDSEWRLIFALCRFGGLRCPSEVLSLKWMDIDWHKKRFTVHSPKTEHHLGQESRIVPLFPELYPYLQDAYDNAKVGAVYCVESYRGTETNLRTQLCRILKRAEIEQWPKLFQNLRSSRETELFKTTQGNIKSVCKWLGNSPAVAMAHYAQSTEADLKAAAEKNILGGIMRYTEEKKPQPESKKAEIRGYNALHTGDEKACTIMHNGNQDNYIKPLNDNDLHPFTTGCNEMQMDREWAIQDSNL